MIIVGVVVALSLVLAFLAALALAKFRFYGRRAFIVLIIGVQTIPLNALIIPIYLVLSKAHQVDKLSGVIVTYLTFVLPFTVWTLRGFMLGVPSELEEAAQVDGSTRFGAFVRILLPLIGPGLVATSIFAFIQAWNEYIMAYVLLHSPEKQTLTVWLASFTTQPGDGVGAADGRGDADRAAGGDLLRRGAAQDRVRADRRRGPRLSSRGLDPAVAACLFPGFGSTVVPDWLRRWLAEGLGGVVLFARNVREPEQVAALCAELRAEQPNLLVATDEEGGDVTRLEAATGSSFPGNLALGAVDDVALTRRVAAAIGGQLASVGIDLDLAPVADVVVDPRNPIVGVRSFGSDPLLVARHVAAFVEGAQGAGVAACAKHFPGHGETSADSHLELPVADADRVTLLARGLPPFRAAVEAGVRAVMTAHIRFPALGGDPATLSPEVIGVLRDELGFGGLVITDALEMRAISGTVGLEEGAVRALAAGADALCLGADRTPDEVERVHGAIVEAARSGRLPEDRLHEAAARVAETAAWTNPKPHWDREAGAEAARRALRVEGDPRIGPGALVIECRPEATIAAGESDHGLAELLPSTEVVRVSEGEELPDPEGRRLVLVLRDAHRYAWQQELVCSGAIVVETGLPEWRPDGAAAFVVTHGAGHANLEALAERLSA